jgi:sugar lactone lactonase YvrE
MNRRTTWVCLLAATLLLVAPAWAEHTRFWRQSDYSDFQKGTPDGVALRSDGKLTPAPRFVPYADPNLAYLYMLRIDSKGRLYGAGGSDAKVVRFDSAGKPTTVFESPELAAQAIAFDAQDNLYVGTSPDGKVYKVTADGKRSVFFDPKAKYIWAIAFDSAGTLFVATGDRGEVFTVSPDGTGKLFYKSEERHARSIAFDAKGNLLIGTDPTGQIIRVNVSRKGSSAAPEAGSGFILYETDKKEVTSLVVDPQGAVYASAIGDKPRPTPIVQPPVPVPPPPVSPGAVNGANGAPQPAPQQAGTPAVFFATMTGGASVVRINSDGSPEEIWTSRDDLIYSMTLSPAGKLWLGTGNSGTLIEIDSNDLFARIAKAPSAQITGFVSGPGGLIYAATANPGKVFSIGPGFTAKGSFESDTFDAHIFSHWGRLTWFATAPGKVALYVRSGNTSRPENSWSAWTGPYKNASGETVTCPAARFIQYKVEFLDTDAGRPPEVSWVSVAYQPINVAPEIDAIQIQEPGVRVQGYGVGGAPTPPPPQLHLPQRPTDAANSQPSGGDIGARIQRPEPPLQGLADKSFQSVVWTAHDDNDDDLIFSVYYRGEGQKNWLLLKDKIDQHFYSWDTNTIADGAYYLRVVASDSPSNPPANALIAEKESDRFEVNNTAPEIRNLRADAAGQPRGAVRIRLEARSHHSELSKVEYNLDAGTWLPVFPTGLLTDAPEETYDFPLTDLSAGEHTIAVRASDRFDNETVSKITFTVAAP